MYTPVFSVRLGVSSEGHFSPTFNASGSGDKSREGKARLPKDTASRGPQIKIMICKDPESLATAGDGIQNDFEMVEAAVRGLPGGPRMLYTRRARRLPFELSTGRYTEGDQMHLPSKVA